MPRVFLSHSQYDRPFIEKVLRPALHQQGIDTWYSRNDIETSGEWHQMVVEGLKTCYYATATWTTCTSCSGRFSISTSGETHSRGCAAC